MDTLLIFFLNSSFLYIGYRRKKSKIREFLPFLYINLKWRAKFQIFRLQIHDSDWLNFIHFSGHKYNRLVSILRKREDQALISISNILKFSAQKELELVYDDILRLKCIICTYILDINGLLSFFLTYHM